MADLAPGPAPVAKVVALTPAQVRIVAGIFKRVIPGALVRVFGSRATGRARRFSDLDLLVVQPAQLTWTQRADLRDLFEASDLPFRVDIVVANSVGAGMAERVAKESVGLTDLASSG